MTAVPVNLGCAQEEVSAPPQLEPEPAVQPKQWLPVVIGASRRA